jgi:radical SAM superfamily enzyme YgiQ (UPF0313 family)
VLGAHLDVPWGIVDGNVEDEPVDAILALSPRVLGVTAMPGPQVADAVRVVAEVKRRRPEVVTVWGGYFPTQHWRACLGSDLVDHVLKGHAEQTFPRLVRGLLEGAIPDLPGLDASPVGPIVDPASHPAYPLEKVDVARYVRPTVLGRRTLGVVTSTGCPFTCNFCAVVSLAAGRWKGLPAERVADLVLGLHRAHGIDGLELYDNNAFVHEGRIREIAGRLAGSGIRWWGEGRIDTLLGFSDATWRALRDGGLGMVFLGAESGDPDTLARMDKGGRQTPEMTLELTRRMKEWGVIPELSFVLGSPPDPWGDAERTLGLIRRIKAVNPETEIVFYLYTPEPVEGELLDGARASGFRWPETLEEWASPAWQDHVQRRSRDLPWLPPGLHRHVRGFERVLNARYPTSTDPRNRGLRKAVLQAAGAWRWKTGFYRGGVELRVLERVLRYRRPETAGF